MSYHDNRPPQRMQDESKKIKEASKNLDPKQYGEDVAERIADKAVKRIKDYGESDRSQRDNEEEQVEELKKIVKQTVREEM